jgi:hypothetical protein
MKTQIKLSLITCFLFLDYCSFSQPLRLDYIEFYDYATILNDLIKNGNKSKYYKALDYESMLYLDKSSYKVLHKVNPSFLIEKNIDTTNIFYKVPEKYVTELSVNFTSIEEMFSHVDTWKNTILRLKNVNLDNKPSMMINNNIYIKDSQKAIITITVEGWSITYRLILKNRKLRFEELYETQI